MEALGINAINMAIYSVMFGIIFWAIKTKLVPALDKSLGERQKEIDKALALSKKMEETLKKTGEENEKTLKKMQLENKEKMEKIMEKANADAKDILEKANAKAKSIVKSGETLIEEERKNLDKELEAKIASMAKKGLIWTKK
jgi:F-type H+-transporting ATPase subunit b